MSEPLTAPEILDDLRAATYVTSLRLAPTSPRFAAMLRDPAFAREAQSIIRDKLTQLEAGQGQFQPHTSARAQTVAGWQRALAKIEKSLHNGGSQPLR